jgi:hypothetical protein
MRRIAPCVISFFAYAHLFIKEHISLTEMKLNQTFLLVSRGILKLNLFYIVVKWVFLVYCVHFLNAITYQKESK